MGKAEAALSPEQEARRAWMGLLAKSDAAHLAECLGAVPALPSFDWLRRPEVGGVMVRGRMGGTGAPFNLGEMTVARCSLRLETGEVGHGYVQGRDKQQAEQAALVDALMQGPRADELRDAVLVPLEEAQVALRTARAAKAAATKVDFFTMVRGED
ncbi:phosphonate C-P lyase system protein PhnG [Celeribacter persicus]|jgi:phosphonate C-P lyase system protein PhnG|uniref:Alpha-D-ribose 1-methylphosphonate 5-triphosphate synthase subunit PhnG n=1 Tax=Celeribacter persicus TaxID=1651082 RepID=A0A2T5HWG9_9RHOB|nr:phosphonate C-P lyase system protein PhnG [Celeribacter persicus]PTQ75895.1 alpha-D-ribose 1-methylphosphonate 5-triphosphate synthase subunit PhnG [Celeribacter persicus]